MALTDTQLAALSEFAGLKDNGDGTYREATEEELEATRSPLVDWKTATVERLTETAEFLKKVDRSANIYAKQARNNAAKRGVTLLNSIYTGE